MSEASSSAGVVVRTRKCYLLEHKETYLINLAASSGYQAPSKTLSRMVVDHYKQAEVYFRRSNSETQEDELGSIRIEAPVIYCFIQYRHREPAVDPTEKLEQTNIGQKGLEQRFKPMPEVEDTGNGFAIVDDSVIKNERVDTSFNRFRHFTHCMDEVLKRAQATDSFAFPNRIESLWDEMYWRAYDKKLKEMQRILQARFGSDKEKIVIYQDRPTTTATKKTAKTKLAKGQQVFQKTLEGKLALK
jgi:hypothetical protein